MKNKLYCLCLLLLVLFRPSYAQTVAQAIPLNGTVDKTPPVITSVTPSDGESNVSTIATVSFTFSEPVKPYEGNIHIEAGEASELIDVHSDRISFSEDKKTVTVTHQPFFNIDTVTIMVERSSFTDLANNSLEYSYSWSFTVDQTPPVIISVTPANGATNVAPDATVSFTFNEPVRQYEGNIHIITSEGSELIDVHGDKISFSEDRRTVTVQHEPFLNNVTIMVEGASFTDLSFNNLRNSYSWSFTTEASQTAIESFTLVNTDTNEDILTFGNEDIIYYADLPTENLSIRANTKGNSVGSVVFMLNGRKVRTESIVPYAIAGDDPQGDYNAWMLPIGSHNLTAIPYTGKYGKGEKGEALTINFKVVGYVKSFTLVNAHTNEDIREIKERDLIDYATLPTEHLSIRANTVPSKVGSVVFELNGRKVKTENIVPYAIAGDDPKGNYNPWELPVGSHTLMATPYATHSGKGEKSTPLTVNFKVINESSVARISNGHSKEPLSLRAFPNPFNTEAQIEFSLKEQAATKLDVYDMRGTFITQLYSGNTEAGKVYTVNLNAGKLVSGVYVIRLVSGNQVKNYRLVLAK